MAALLIAALLHALGHGVIDKDVEDIFLWPLLTIGTGAYWLFLNNKVERNPTAA